MLPFAIGAVVDGIEVTSQTPLSGQVWPVEAVVPIGFLIDEFIPKTPNYLYMSNFHLENTFDIDDGQLDGLTPQTIFVLGYELSDISRQLSEPTAFTRLIHAENKARIEKACKAAGRRFSLTWSDSDSSESWLTLEVTN